MVSQTIFCKEWLNITIQFTAESPHKCLGSNSPLTNLSILFLVVLLYDCAWIAFSDMYFWSRCFEICLSFFFFICFYNVRLTSLNINVLNLSSDEDQLVPFAVRLKVKLDYSCNQEKLVCISSLYCYKSLTLI